MILLSLRFSSKSKARNATKPGACSWFCAPRVSCVVQTVAIEIKHTAPRPCNLTGWHSWSKTLDWPSLLVDRHSSGILSSLLGFVGQQMTTSNQIKHIKSLLLLKKELKYEKGDLWGVGLWSFRTELPLTMLRLGQGLITNDATLLRDVAQIDLNICTIRVGTCGNYVAVGGTCWKMTKTVWISQIAARMPWKCQGIFVLRGSACKANTSFDKWPKWPAGFGLQQVARVAKGRHLFWWMLRNLNMYHNYVAESF